MADFKHKTFRKIADIKGVNFEDLIKVRKFNKKRFPFVLVKTNHLTVVVVNLLNKEVTTLVNGIGPALFSDGKNSMLLVGDKLVTDLVSKSFGAQNTMVTYDVA